MTPSGHIIGHQDVQSTSRLVRNGNVLGMQQRLRRAGYGIATDGVWGPQSQAAYTHYTNTLDHFQRQQWNIRSHQLAAHPVKANPQELLQHFGFAGATALRRQANQNYAYRTFNQEVVLRHPTPQRPGLTRYQGRNYVTHLVPTRYGQSVVVGGPSHPSAVGRFLGGVAHGIERAPGRLWTATGGNLLAQGFASVGGHGSQEEVNRQLRRTRGAASGIGEFVAPAVFKPIEGKGVGAWDVANTALWLGGPLKFAGAGIEGGIGVARALEAARAAEAAGETEQASRLFQYARALRTGAGEAGTAFREGTGVIRPAAQRLNLPPITRTGRALSRIPAIRAFDQHVDERLANREITRLEAANEKRGFRQLVINASKESGQGATGLAQRLELPQEPGLASELHPNSLYQGRPPTLSAEGMPDRLRIKGLTPKVYNLIKRGAEYRDWYKRGAAVIQDFADRLALSPKQAAGIIAVTSQGANPTFNLRRAAEAVQAVRAGEDISHTMLGGQFDKVKHIIENPETFDWSGVKTNNYFANFYKHLNPKDYEAMYGADAKHATIDRHMAQMFLGKEAPTPAQYRRLKDVMVRTGDALGWSPEEVQAAAWVPWKAQQMGVTQQVKGFLREADAAGTLPKELQIPKSMRGQKLTKEAKALHAARSAWAREQLTGTLPAGWERHLPTAADAYERGQALYRAPEGEHPGAGDYLYQHELPKNDHTFNSSIAQVHSEIRPDEHFWPERAAMFDRLPAQQKIEYARLTDDAIGHEFEDALGMQVSGKRAGQGIWRGQYSPGIAHHVFVGDEVTAGTEAELNALSAAKGMAKHQTSVSWGRPLRPSEGEFKGIHWVPPEGADPAALSDQLDRELGPGNVGFIHAPDGGYYVIDFNGRLGSRASVTKALRDLGGKQVDIGWDGGYTIDARIAGADDWGNRYQAAIDDLPEHQRSALDLAMARVRARTDAIDEHFFGRKGAHIVSLEEAKALEAQGTHVFHGTGGMTAEQIMAERRLRVGDRHREGAWVTTNPETADWYASGFTGHGSIVAIPKDQIPFGQGYAEHPFGAYGSPDDVLFQRTPGEGRVDRALNRINRYGRSKPAPVEPGEDWYAHANPQATGADKLSRDLARGVARLGGHDESTLFQGAGKYDHLSLDELHARHDELMGRYNRVIDELAAGEGRPGDYKRLTAFQNAQAKKMIRRTGKPYPTVKEMLRQRAETHFQDVLDANPEHPHVIAHNADMAEANVLRQEIYRRNDQLFQQEPEAIKGAYQRLPGGRGAISLTDLADVGTAQHELMHHIRPFLTPEMERVAREAAGLKPGEAWTRTAEEHFADSWLTYLHEGKDVPRNWADILKTMTPQMRKAYKVEELPEITDAQRAMYKKLGGHDQSSAIGQMLLRNTRAAGRLAADQSYAPKGAPRSHEEAMAHIGSVNDAARHEGYGVKTVDIKHMKPGEQTELTGGPEGERVRAVMAGRVWDKDSMGTYERIGAQQQVRSTRQAIKEAEALRSPERARRIAARNDAFQRAGGGLQGYYAAKGELRGAYPTVDLGQTPGLNNDAVDTLLNLIEHHPLLEGKSFTKTRAQDALLKVVKGEKLQRNEQGLLERIFGRELRPQNIREFARNLGWRGWSRELINLPRSFMATLDQSAMFRHGIMTLAHSPKLWARQFGPMYRALFSATYADAWQKALQEFHNYALADKSGVQFTNLGTDPLKREEQYMSVMAEQIPGLGRIVKASDRSYVGVLNAMRMGLFDKLAYKAARAGWDLNDEHLSQSIAKFVNSASGRGDLGALRNHAVTLQSLLFSPRLLASRINFMNPLYYSSLHPFARRQALRSLATLVGGAMAVAAAARAAGLNVVMDPRNADFMKIKHGNTRIDFLGGFQQPIVLAATLLSGTRISSTTGLPEKLSGGVAGTSRFDVLWRFFQNKMAPVPGGFIEALQGQDPQTHEPLGWKQFGLPSLHPGRLEQNFWASHTFPLLIQDIASLHGGEHFLDPLPALGIGVQAYGPPPKGQHYQDKLITDSHKAGLPTPPKVVITDAHWQGELDNKITQGMSSYDKMKAAAEVFDQKYGTNIEPKLAQSITTQGAADKVYQDLRPKIAPAYDHWKSIVDRVNKAKASTAPVKPKGGGGGIVHSIEHGIGSLLGAAASPLATGSASAAVMPRGGGGAANRNLANTGSGGGGGGAAGLPPELGQAIAHAAARYGVPASTLAGIWRIESGSTYPNPAVNSSGYGGLFGTTKWNAPTQEQANYAAQTLRHLLDTHGGNMAAALHAYSGGGYTSVPGGGGGWNVGRGAGGSQFAPAAMGGSGAAPGPPINSVTEEALQMMASGTYNPSKLLSDALHTMSSVPLQGNVQGINFVMPKGGKAAGAARGAIALAEHFLGTPYAWGGESPSGFDCSGLLQYVWARMGVRIPRTSQEQWRAGRRVSIRNLRPGDAVFFEPTASGPGHVGMYIGGGRFIESPHTGATVRISNLRGYPGYMGARRFSRR